MNCIGRTPSPGVSKEKEGDHNQEPVKWQDSKATNRVSITFCPERRSFAESKRLPEGRPVAAEPWEAAAGSCRAPFNTGLV